MSSSIWTPAALSSNARPAAGRCWRLVEAQHYVSTAKLTDTAAEQERLDRLIEASKPAIPEECRHLDYLLFTSFRYGPYPRGSRFRRAGLTPGVFYGSELVRTAATEVTFHRLLFFAELPDTSWPANPAEYTALAVEYAAGRTIDLTRVPFERHRAIWVHPTDYEPCQNLANVARVAEIDLVRYELARDLHRGSNTAILSCRAFAQPREVDRQTWRIHLDAQGARALCERPRLTLDFSRESFPNDPRIVAMTWDRRAY